MKHHILCRLAVAAVLSAGTGIADYTPPGSPAAGGIADLALIYQGGYNKIDWNQQHFAPYLTWTNPVTRGEEWLFDGFLFLELYSGNEFVFASLYLDPYSRYATKADLQWWINNRVFVKGKGIDALDKALGAVIQRIGPPPRPRKVVLMVGDAPILKDLSGALIADTKYWGELNGNVLDFKNVPDRVAACKWYIDQLLARWNAEAYQNLELAGFYMLSELICWYPFPIGSLTDRYAADKILNQELGNYVRSLGKRWYWIPAWGSSVTTWKNYGFDVAYQQPNHFFSTSVPDSRLTDACNLAKSLGMGLEMEWDVRVFTSTQTFAPRMSAYLDYFAQHGVWGGAAVAHFMDGGPNPAGFGMTGLSQSTDPQIVALYRRYCSIIAGRQGPHPTPPPLPTVPIIKASAANILIDTRPYLRDLSKDALVDARLYLRLNSPPYAKIDTLTKPGMLLLVQ